MSRFVLVIGLCCVSVGYGQPAGQPAPQPAPKPATPATQPAPKPAVPAAAQPATGTQPASPLPSKLSIADLEKMLGAIALYPDNLLANVLASSVYPLEVQQVHRYMSGGGKIEQLEKDGIEPPIQALAKVPDVLKMLNDNLEWTEAIGQAYLLQAEDVMKAVQNLRAKAKANGVLQTGDQQTVVEQGSTIIIEQSQPDVVYVPSYDPQVVYVDHYDGGDAVAAGIIGFGVGVAVGAVWHNHYCDWHGGCVGWGHGDVDVDIDRGDINIDNSRNNNINRNDLKNTNVGRNRAGQTGQPWKPNPNKASASNLSKPGGAASMDKFRGASAGQLPAGTKMPNPKRDTPAAANRAGSANRAPSAGNTAVRPSTPSRPSAPARPAAAPSAPRNVPSAPSSASRAGSGANRPAPSAPSAPRAQPSRSGGFSSSPATRSQSSRGAASRGGGGGGSRGGGGGSRGGGGGRR